VTGFISEPQPEAIAEYIDWLYYNRDDSIKMGRRGYEYYRFKDISWDRVISKLMG
jgi:glycosyltransferase involved in cell wall biosynthesis